MVYKKDEESWATEQNGVAVESAKLDQRAKEDDLLKFFKEHQCFFCCIKLNYTLLLTSPNFGGIFNEIFK